MRPALALAISLLAGCAHQLTAECAWGARREAMAGHCAVQNFGPEGAAFLKERDNRCGGCGLPLLQDDLEFCLTACPHDAVVAELGL